MTTPNAASVAASMSDSVRDQLARKHAVYLTSASVLEILEEALSSAPQQTADEKDALLRQALDADGDSLTIAYLHGFANGKDAALTASTAHPSPAQQPLTDEHKAILKECRNQAMRWTLDARPPEAGAFGAIAQDLDYLCAQLGVKND